MLTANLAMVNTRLTSTDSSRPTVSTNMDLLILGHRNDHQITGK